MFIRLMPWCLSACLLAAFTYGHRATLGLTRTSDRGDRTEFSERMKASHSMMSPGVPPGRVTLLGDSITQAFYPQDERLAHLVNYGAGSDTTLNLLDRLPILANLRFAKAIVVEIGINDLFRRSPGATAANIARVVQALPDGVPIVLSEILPIHERRLANIGSRRTSNAEILEVNTHMSKFCRDRCRIASVRSLADEDHNLKDAYDFGDGLHLSAAGYRAWEAAILVGLEGASAQVPVARGP